MSGPIKRTYKRLNRIKGPQNLLIYPGKKMAVRVGGISVLMLGIANH